MAKRRTRGNSLVIGIRVYFEGHHALRAGFAQFFEEVINLARRKRLHWSLISCDSRQEAFDDFSIAQRTHPDSLNILLVDSEGPVSLTPASHLKSRDEWINPGAEEEQIHLMVQVMETWFVADLDAVEQFYGKGFARKVFSGAPVEAISKEDVFKQLDTATKSTSKGQYHKVRHGPDLLKRIRADVVRRAAPHCERLFVFLLAHVA